ncbi:MAG: urease accessory protein UreF, partial [Rhodospirillales bacterium]|nr:urease accessory protein UreF [Rhodospirillales bacterium]
GLFRFAWEAVIDEDEEAFARIAERADALMGTSELALESRNQGLAFISTVRAAWLQLELRPWTSVLKTIGRQPRYAVAVAMVTAVARVPLRSALTAFVHAFAANLVSAGVRLIPLGQTDGQRVVAILETAVSDTVDLALSCSPENFGSATPVVDWTSMRHETQYTRLFRS